jgi:hypothetical protein
LLRESLSKILITTTTTAAAPLPCSVDSPPSPPLSLSPSPPLPRVCAVKLSNNKYMACDHLVCDETLQAFFAPPSAAPPVGEGVFAPEESVRFVQRQMILVEPFLSPAVCGGGGGGEGGDSSSTRGVCIFPAGTPGLNNSHAVYLLQLDESTQVAPRGAYLAYLMTYIPCSTTTTTSS